VADFSSSEQARSLGHASSDNCDSAEEKVMM